MRDRSYRKIFEEHYGPIPKDLEGRSFEIHHIDGNSSNNDPSNLVALSLKEHYEVHFNQGDWGACWIMARKMKISPDELSKIGREMAKKAGPRDDEWRAKQRASQTGKKKGPHSEETKRKISESNKGGKGFVGRHSEETLMKLRQPKKNKENYRKPKSEEHKQKMRESAIKAWEKRRSNSNSR